MIFNSFEFLIFLSIVFILYWFVLDKNLKIQNLLILVSSYIFYGWWDYRFLSLIFISTIVDFIIGLNIPKQDSEKKQKLLVWCSVLFNLSLLGFFKYYNFFVDSWIDLFNSIGYEIKGVKTLNIILPVGISFYTFQTMSYTIDIFRKKSGPTKDFISFASFVSFFPQLVAGPIESASNLLSQIQNKREFKYKQGVQGFKLILWGLFKKVVIADQLSPIVDNIFDNNLDLGGGILWLGAIYFTFQIYCDFSGYSDIAVGTAKLFGFELMSNFKFPYFSRNIGEFWRRWHISLTTWFTDYLYIPLKLKYRDKGYFFNFIILKLYFLTIGLWHGSNWNYIMFGLYHSIFFIPTLFNPKFYKLKTPQISFNTKFPSLKEIIQVVSTFFLVTIGFVFFRSENLNNSFKYLKQMFTDFSFKSEFEWLNIYFLCFIMIEYLIRKNERLKDEYFKYDWILFSILSLFVLLFLRGKQQFIYFQF